MCLENNIPKNRSNILICPNEPIPSVTYLMGAVLLPAQPLCSPLDESLV